VVLLILAVIWAAVLIPGWVQSRREGRAARSFADYRRRLSTIELASRREGAYSVAMHLDAPRRIGQGDGAGTAGEHRIRQRRDDRHGTDDDDPAGPAGAGIAAAYDDVVAAGAVSPSSRLALRRRRQVFFGLLAAVAGTLGAAVVQSTMTAWALHAGVALLFVVYVGLLVSHHRRVVEQVAKVRYLEPPQQVRAQRPAVVVLRSGTGR
jgi:hypothetical protein